MEDKTLIEYVIQGTNDEGTNKQRASCTAREIYMNWKKELYERMDKINIKDKQRNKRCYNRGEIT